MSFDLSEMEASALASARAVGAAGAAGARWDHESFRALGAAGLLGAPLPESHGGGGRGAFMTALLHEGFGRGSGDTGLAISWGAHTLRVGVPIATLGTEEQRRSLLPGLASGAVVGAIAAKNGAFVARRARDRWVLEGTSEGVVNGPVAGLFLVSALTHLPNGTIGRTAFLLPRGTPGLRVGEPARMVGMHGALFGVVALEGAEIGDDGVLGVAGSGDAALALGRRFQRACLSAHWVGAMEAALERAMECAKTRVDFGRPLAQSQAARATLADMKVRCEIGRRLVYCAAHAVDHGGREADRHAALAALHIAVGAPLAARDALSIHGAEAALADHPATRDHRDAAMIEVAWESVAHLKSIVGGALLGMG